MKITRAGTTASRPGPQDWFTGAVRIDALFPAEGGRRASAATVTFEPGARTRWHTHPLGQTLIVIAGLGWVQRQNGPKESIRPGDVVFFEPGERHWHGASAEVAMSHIAVQETFENSNVEWLEAVSNEQYGS